MDAAELKTAIEAKLNKQVLSGRLLLDNMRVIDEDSRKTSAYNCHNYVQFYYYLGTFIQPTSLIEIGFRLGLFSANFLRSCKTVNRFLAFQEKTVDFYSPKLGKANVKDHYKGLIDIYIGSIHDEIFEQKMTEFDLCIINEEVNYDKHREYLDAIWSKLQLDGFIVMDYVNWHKPAGEAYFDFCKAKNREPVIVETRYGVGIIRK